MYIKYLTAIVLILHLALLSGCKHKVEKKDSTTATVAKNDHAANKPANNISIHEAALNGLSAEIDKIVEGGSDINVKDGDGRTALMYAAYNGHTGIMEKLISKGAAVNLKDNFGRTALMFASSGPYAEAVRLLLNNQADPNLTDKEEHFTALMYAAAEGQAEVVKILLTFKADPRLKDADGDEAITFARNNGHNDIVKLLQPFMK